MIPLFLGLTLANLTGLLIAAILGYITASHHDMGQWHMLAGALAALVCCAVHCIVFTYFIATAKWIQHAITVKHLDASLSTPTRSFRAQAFPAALSAMAMVFLTAILGAIVDNYGLNTQWHHVAALATVAINALAALIEFGAVRRNGLLIDRILELANPPAAPASATPAPR